MTAPDRKLVITPELVERFRRYLGQHSAWGVLHVVMDDGNFDVTLSDPLPLDDAESAELAAICNKLSPSQRRKLRDKVEGRWKR